MNRFILYVLLASVLVCCVVSGPSEVGQACESDNDCNPPYDTCNMGEKECQHKSVFPLEATEYFGSIVLGVMIALSNAAGTGGGGLIVPICMIFFQFSTKQSVAMSNFCIFWASLTRFVVNYNKKHPEKDAKVIDYSTAMIMFPMVLVGALFGVQINVMMPEAIILMALSILLIFLSFHSTIQSIKIRKKENKAIADAQVSPSSEQKAQDVKSNDSSSNKSGSDPKQSTEEEGKSPSKTTTTGPMILPRLVVPPEESKDDLVPREENVFANYVKTEEEEESFELLKIKNKEKTHWKPSSYLLVPFIFVMFVILNLFRGSSKGGSSLSAESWSPLDFSVLAMLILFMIVMTVVDIGLVKREFHAKERLGFKFAESDLKWTTKMLTQFIIAAILAGFIAGSLGQGGGIVFNPLLLSFKVNPMVASSTGMYMIMYSSLANVFLYILAGYLHIGFAFWAGVYVIVGTAMGLKIINKLVVKSGRPSYIAFLFAGIIILSAIVIPTYGTFQVLTNLQNGNNIFEFGQFCG